MRLIRTLFFAVVVVVCNSVLCQKVIGQTFSEHQYTEDTGNIPNPERGFYHHTETQSAIYSPLDEATLRSYRTQGITMILRVFYLSDFVSKPISEKYLSSVSQDFSKARSAGVKVIVRFAYTQKSSPPFGDATPEWVLKHIAQLKPILKQNGDVIALLQSGFIGAWGEWYYTDHFSQIVGSPSANDWVNRRAVVNALLDAMPDTRAIQVRTPAIKFSLLESTVALTGEEAFNKTKKARIGHHNDCFLASGDDYGTYTGNMEAEKIFLAQETNYLPMGGETCGEDIPISECPNALAQMERFHWSFLNRDYHPGVLNSWVDGTCMPEVYRKLGYRFRMIKSSVQDSGNPGGGFKLTLELVNDAWANPYNKRLVELVLRQRISGEILTLKLDEDPRRWTQTDTVKITANAGLPKDLKAGAYDVFLNMPDPEESLFGNPSYSIRLANTDVWDNVTGYNKLGHTFTVSNSASAQPYSGNSFFLSKPEVIEYSSIIVDGEKNDWAGIKKIAVSDNQLYDLKAFNTSDSIYFLVEGTVDESCTIFINASNSGDGGEIVSPWNAIPAQYKIDTGILLKFENNAWVAIGNILNRRKDESLEISVGKNLFTGVPLGNELSAGVIVSKNDQETVFPEGDFLASYKLLLNTPQALQSTSSGNKVILYWGDQSEAATVHRVVERSVNGTDFEKIAEFSAQTFTMTDWPGAPAVKYRAFNTSDNGDFVSMSSEAITVTLADRPPYYTFTADGDAGEWADVAPLATNLYHFRTQAYRIFADAVNLNILYEGSTPSRYAFYFDADNSVSSGSDNNAWSYHGFDFMVRNDSVYDLRQNPIQFKIVVQKSVSVNSLELSFPLSILDNLGSNNMIVTSAQVFIEDEVLYFPNVVSEPVVYLRLTPSDTPASVSVSNSIDAPDSELVVQWGACSSCLGYVIERSIGDANNFSTIATKNQLAHSFYDETLSKGITYFYRVFTYNEVGLSASSSVVSAKTGSVVSVENALSLPLSVYPNPMGDFVVVKLSSSKHAGFNYQILTMLGQCVNTGSVPADESEIVIRTSLLPPGRYILKFSGRQYGHVSLLKK
jgi:hypothetical protein